MQDRMRVAANAVISHEGHVLLVKFSGGTDREHYNFPGDGVESSVRLWGRRAA